MTWRARPKNNNSPHRARPLTGGKADTMPATLAAHAEPPGAVNPRGEIRSGRGNPQRFEHLKKYIYINAKRGAIFRQRNESRAATPAGSGRAIWKRGANYKQTCFLSCRGFVARLAPGRTVCGAARWNAAENAPTDAQKRPRCDKY